jgi:hypothetical protein
LKWKKRKPEKYPTGYVTFGKEKAKSQWSQLKKRRNLKYWPKLRYNRNLQNQPSCPTGFTVCVRALPNQSLPNPKNIQSPRRHL